jgi:hypothetical protein
LIPTGHDFVRNATHPPGQVERVQTLLGPEGVQDGLTSGPL